MQSRMDVLKRVMSQKLQKVKGQNRAEQIKGAGRLFAKGL